MKIAVATNYTEGYRELAEVTMPSKREYCERHGYAFIPFFNQQNPERLRAGEVTMASPPDPHYDGGGYVRFENLYTAMYGEPLKPGQTGPAHLFGGYDAVFWCDCDALIMNHTKRIEEFIDDDTTLVLTADCNRLNDGNLIAVDRGKTRQLLWQLTRKGGAQHEYQRHPCGWGEPYGCQAVLRNYIYTEPYNRGIKWVEQRELDSNLNTHYGFPGFVQGQFERGDFVLHLPGMAWSDRMNYARKYAGEIVR